MYAIYETRSKEYYLNLGPITSYEDIWTETVRYFGVSAINSNTFVRFIGWKLDIDWTKEKQVDIVRKEQLEKILQKRGFFDEKD